MHRSAVFASDLEQQIEAKCRSKQTKNEADEAATVDENINHGICQVNECAQKQKIPASPSALA